MTTCSSCDVSINEGDKRLVGSTVRSTVDISMATVEFAFIVGTAAPGPGDWIAGSWLDVDEVSADKWVGYAQILAGASGADAELDAGVTYRAYLRVSGNPEVVSEKIGTVSYG